MRKIIRPLRVLLIYPGFPPEEDLAAGVSTCAFELASGLKSLGQKVTVISRSEKVDKIECQIVDEISIHRMPSRLHWFKYFGNLMDFKHFGVLLYDYMILRLIKYLEKRDGNFDVIEVGDFGSEGFALLKDYNDKLIVRCHTPAFIAQKYNPLNPPYLSRLAMALEKRTLLQAKHLASPSWSLMKEILKQGTILADIKLQNYPFANRTNYWKKGYKTNFCLDSPMRIIVVGRLEQRKGQDIVCQALNLLNDCNVHLTIDFVGLDTPTSDGTTYKQYLLNILFPESKKKVRFLGLYPRNNVLKLYPNYDLYILSSRFESLGYVVLEAMRAGLPVVAANIGEMPNIIEDNINGILVDPDNPIALSKILLRLYRSPDNLKKIGREGRKYIATNYGNKSIKRILSHYLCLLQDNMEVPN